jgi:hypothetical protein
MKKTIYSLWLMLFLLIPLTTFGQNQSVVWPWPVNEDTLFIPDLSGTGMFLNTIIAADTNGTGWQGAAGKAAWLNHTRVYVLAKNGYFPCNAILVLNSRVGEKLMIRGETGNYVVPAHYPTNPANDWYPQIYFAPTATGMPQGSGVRLSRLFDTLMLKQVSICGRDESLLGSLDKIQGNMIEIMSTGSGSIYVDRCMLKTINGQIMQIGSGGSIHAYTVRLTNSLIADMGFIGNGNLGAGRGIDCRNSMIDSLIVENNTWINFQDRVIRHYISAQPILSFKFNHNTVMNGMSYCGTISLGLLDSLGNGPFEIKDNLFLDNFAMGPDTDALRASEFTDSPDRDSRNGNYKISWIVARPNTTGHITPWVISNNYYCVTDSGLAIRNLTSPYLYVPNPDPEEPIMTSDIKRQLQANGGDTLTAFRKVMVSPKYAPPSMTKLIRWYFTLAGAGVGGNDQSNVGAGAGRQKTGSGSGTGTPATNFIHDVTNNVWVYDFNRRKTEWYMDSLDCSFSSSTILSSASSDGKIVGDTRWSFTLIPVITGAFSPKTIDFGIVAKNASKTDTVVVSSTGNSPLVVDSVKSTAAEFTITPATATIFAGQSAKFVITYHPTTPGAKSGSVVFYHNGTTQQDTVAVSGDVIAAASFDATPTSFAFGKVEIGKSKQDSLTVTNHGTIDLTVTSIVSSNPVFTITPATATVGVESTQKFYVTFAPTAVGVVSAKIAFNHNALTKDTILVSGEGQTPVGVAGLRTGIPTVYQIHDNYPNPFNPSTTILYDLPQQSRVTIRVYSILGQETATLVDGVIAAGYHQVTWKGEHDGGTQVAGGVYFFRISAQSFTKGTSFVQTKKMLLIK